jgi:hypothetical protein
MSTLRDLLAHPDRVTVVFDDDEVEDLATITAQIDADLAANPRTPAPRGPSGAIAYGPDHALRFMRALFAHEVEIEIDLDGVEEPPLTAAERASADRCLAFVTLRIAELRAAAAARAAGAVSSPDAPMA